MLTTIIRTAILYIFVTVAIRIMGKRQIGDMQPNELVITLLISEIAAIPLQDSNQPLLNGVAAICVLVILEVAVSVAVMKSGFLRKMLNGSSVVIIKDGKIDIKQMKRVRLTVIDLIEMLRSKDVFNLSDVAFAVLEVNGDISVLLKSEAEPATRKDLSAKAKPNTLLLPVVSDGKIVKESLSYLKIDKSTVMKNLNGKDLSDIFLMTADENGNFNVPEVKGK